MKPNQDGDELSNKEYAFGEIPEDETDALAVTDSKNIQYQVKINLKLKRLK